MSIEDMIYEGFRRFLVKNLRIYDRNDVIHVSEAIQCLRKSWYSRKFGDRELKFLDDRKKVILGLGLSTHLVLENVLREMGYEVEKEVSKKIGDITLTGTVDAINSEHVLELKTINRIPDNPLQHHVLQLNTYLGLTDLKKGYIVYICKRDGSIKVFEIEFNENLFNIVVERANELYASLVKNIEPPRDIGFNCSYCEWRERCYNESK